MTSCWSKDFQNTIKTDASELKAQKFALEVHLATIYIEIDQYSSNKNTTVTNCRRFYARTQSRLFGSPAYTNGRHAGKCRFHLKIVVIWDNWSVMSSFMSMIMMNSAAQRGLPSKKCVSPFKLMIHTACLFLLYVLDLNTSYRYIQESKGSRSASTSPKKFLKTHLMIDHPSWQNGV